MVSRGAVVMSIIPFLWREGELCCRRQESSPVSLELLLK
jgi:hypothetical protein